MAAFDKALRIGRRQTNQLFFWRKKNNLVLTINSALQYAPPAGEVYAGIRDIKVRRIIGTENRSQEFSRDFYPVKRWLARRWTTIYELMIKGSLSDAISVLEYGGYYFVRDGNHRVSVAKYQEKEYLTAEITRFELPFSLPPRLSNGNLELLGKKYSFHMRTGAFDIIPEEEFRVERPETWAWLEREICEFNRSWFLRKHSREPESKEELLSSWYKNLYRNAVDYIRRNSLLYLFPGRRETDIFVELVKLWNSFEDPDSIWLGEIFRLFIEKKSRHSFLRGLLQSARRKIVMLRRSPEEEYRIFAGISQIEELVPGFEGCRRRQGFYTFLYTQLVHVYAVHLKEKLNRAPYIQKLTPAWYREFYAPVRDRWQEGNTSLAFEVFYRKFSRKYLKKILTGRITFDQAMYEFTPRD
ncbi:MAG: hypothetical protein ACP5IA_02840 [Sediminispirochaetaceae bacterium]